MTSSAGHDIVRGARHRPRSKTSSAEHVLVRGACPRPRSSLLASLRHHRLRPNPITSARTLLASLSSPSSADEIPSRPRALNSRTLDACPQPDPSQKLTKTEEGKRQDSPRKLSTSELSIGGLSVVGGSRWFVGPVPDMGECNGRAREWFRSKTEEKGLPESCFVIERRRRNVVARGGSDGDERGMDFDENERRREYE